MVKANSLTENQGSYRQYLIVILSFFVFLFLRYEKAKSDLAEALKAVNTQLEGKTYLVKDQITLADITLASTLIYPMKLVCDPEFLKPFGNVEKWFKSCVSQSEFKDVIGEVTMCKKELMAKGAEQ